MNAAPLLFRSMVLTALACSCSVDTGGRESPGDKTEWSVLQGVEYKGRGAPAAAPEITKVQGYDVLRVPSASGKGNFWILLSPEAPPFYKQMPRGDFHLTRSQLDHVLRASRVSSTVEEVLESRVVE